jgi:predicted lipid carrier protein YhbT
MAKYLSQEWLDRLVELGSGLPAAGVTARVQHVVPGSPDGEVRYVVSLREGRVVEATLGGDDDADVSYTTPYPSAVKLLTGEADANAEFMAGRAKVTGSTGTLLTVLALTGTEAFAALRDDLAAATDL